MGEQAILWKSHPTVALCLWVSIPSGSVEIDVFRRALVLSSGILEQKLCVSPMLKVLSLHRFCPPLPIGCIYVGVGSSEFGLKPSVWLNPFSFFEMHDVSLKLYLSFSRMRPDLRNWLAPLAKASALVCDCKSHVCHCHASLLIDLLVELSDPVSSNADPECCDDRDCPTVEPQEAESDVVVSMGQVPVNETTRGNNIPLNVGHPSSWTEIIEEVRASPQRIFWEIFAGCAILTSMLLERNWCCGPPIDVVIDSSFNLLNPAFLSVLLGLVFEGRVALLHVGLPCSSFSWIVGKVMQCDR